jgi:succinate dehydrogenase / fumarate reductase iron-sulfur subunit
MNGGAADATLPAIGAAQPGRQESRLDHQSMRLKLKVWRQDGPQSRGEFREYHTVASEHMSFLEMLDVVNEGLISKGELPIEFDHDCREGICGTCSLMINGVAHGPRRATTTCQLHMREFHDGQEIVIEPWRASAFPVIRDLVVDREALDRIIASGGFISAPTGSSPDGNAILVPKPDAELAMDAAACIGCGACVAACPNASAMLFTAAKVSHLGLLPQGQPERDSRVLAMVNAMDEEGFGGCTNIGECEAACPKEISLANIARLNREYLRATLTRRPTGAHAVGG